MCCFGMFNLWHSLKCIHVDVCVSVSGAGCCPRSVCVSSGYGRSALSDHVSEVQQQKKAHR